MTRRDLFKLLASTIGAVGALGLVGWSPTTHIHEFDYDCSERPSSRKDQFRCRICGLKMADRVPPSYIVTWACPTPSWDMRNRYSESIQTNTGMHDWHTFMVNGEDRGQCAGCKSLIIVRNKPGWMDSYEEWQTEDTIEPLRGCGW